MREENPVAYFKGLLSLLPKDVSLEVHTDELPVFHLNFSASKVLLEKVIREAEEQRTAELVKYS